MLDHEEGALEAAKKGYEDAIALSRRTGDCIPSRIFLGPMGAALASLGDLDGAVAAFDEAEATARASGRSSRLVAITIHRGHVDLALAEKAAERGEAGERSRHLRAAENRLLAAVASESDDEVCFARRLLERALVPSIEQDSRNALVVAEDGSWFRPPGGSKAPLARLRSLRRGRGGAAPPRCAHAATQAGNRRITAACRQGSHARPPGARRDGAQGGPLGALALRATGLGAL